MVAERAGEEMAVERRRQGQVGDALGRLVIEIGRAVDAGWGQTARLVVLLATTGGAVALILVASR